MTSKEALQKLKLLMFERGEDVRDINKNLVLLDVIEKDLEILEILKYRIHLYDSKKYNIAWVEASGFVPKNSEEYTLLKEWSEND